MPTERERETGEILLDSELEVQSTCVWCQSAKVRKAYEGVVDWAFHSVAGRWSYWRCGECGSLFLSPRPAPAVMHKAYRSYYTHLPNASAGRIDAAGDARHAGAGSTPEDRLLQGGRLGERLRRRMQNLAFPMNRISHLPAGNLLDVGCGNGRVLAAAAALGWQATGVDLDQGAVAAARARGLNARVGSFEQIGEYVDHFDCVVCSHVLEHVYQPQALLALIYRALKPGGVALFAYPNPQSWVLRLFGKHWRGLEAPRHLSLPAPEAVLRALPSAALVTIQAGSVQTLADTVGRVFTPAPSSVRRAAVTLTRALMLPFKIVRPRSGCDVVEIQVRKP